MRTDEISQCRGKRGPMISWNPVTQSRFPNTTAHPCHNIFKPVAAAAAAAERDSSSVCVCESEPSALIKYLKILIRLCPATAAAMVLF